MNGRHFSMIYSDFHQKQEIREAKSQHTSKYFVDFFLIVEELEWRQEAEGAQMESHQRRHTFLQELMTRTTVETNRCQN